MISLYFDQEKKSFSFQFVIQQHWKFGMRENQNINSCFSHYWKGLFDIFHIHLVSFKNQQLLVDKFFWKFICTCSLFKYIQPTMLIKDILVNNIPFRLYQSFFIHEKSQNVSSLHFINIGYKYFLSYF